MVLLTDFILVFGFSITTVLLFTLLNSKRRQLPQNILIVFLSFIAITIASFYADLHELKFLYLFTMLFESGERFMLAPLVYLYVKSLFLKNKDLIKAHLVHFIPFLVYWFVFTLPFVVSYYQDQLIFDYLKPFVGTPYMALLKDAYLLIYLGLSIGLFYRFNGIMKFNFSNDVTSSMEWLKKFLFSFFGLMLFDFLITLYELLFGYFTPWDTGYITAIIMIFLVVYLGYNGIRQSMITMPDFLLDGGFGVMKNKSSRTSLDMPDEELKGLKEKLQEIMKNEKPYLSPDLTLGNLADLIGTTNRKLSILLNHSLKISFYDFINEYRIQAVKKKMKSDEFDNYSVLGIAYDAGFKSKSSFYRIFKKETGISPTEYKKSMDREKSLSASD